MNELIFVGHTLFISFCVLFSLRFQKEGLVALSATLWLLANLFVTKQITLFGLPVTASDAFVIGASLATALLTELFGKQYAEKSVFISFGILALFAALSFIHSSYEPNSYDTTQTHFEILLSPMPRIVFASIFAYLISQLLNVTLSTWFKKWAKNKFFASRTLIVILITQAFDTLFFGFVGLYGLVYSLTSVLLISFMIKSIALFITAPLVIFLKPRKGS